MRAAKNMRSTLVWLCNDHITVMSKDLWSGPIYLPHEDLARFVIPKWSCKIDT